MAGLWDAHLGLELRAQPLGMFAAAGEALCKSLFLAGVTFRSCAPGRLARGRRELACSLYADLIGQWGEA